MKKSPWARLGRQLRMRVRKVLAALPSQWRFAFFRNLINCEPKLGQAFEFKIAQTQDELEACFALLHDAYVASGFMRPHASGLRVTPYHALPTTTTLCAKVGERVVGTLSIVREGVFGFPMQTAFDISSVRAMGGRIAEISALAVHPAYRKTGGAILFPLMKFMYEYCTKYFDTRHLVIAVHPNKIELYESLLFFSRLTAQVVDKYDFANGAPAIGATLDLSKAPDLFERAYKHKPARRNLHHYFTQLQLPQIKFPPRTLYTSNDPVLTPELVDYFFKQRTQNLEPLGDHWKKLLHSIYKGRRWASVLPSMATITNFDGGIRRNPRFTFKCPAELTPVAKEAPRVDATIVEISIHGFKARSSAVLTVGAYYTVQAELGPYLKAQVQAELLRQINSESGQLFGFRINAPDDAWQRCVRWLQVQERAEHLGAIGHGHAADMQQGRMQLTPQHHTAVL